MLFGNSDIIPPHKSFVHITSGAHIPRGYNFYLILRKPINKQNHKLNYVKM